MTPETLPAIESDIRRWSRARWMLVVSLFIATQLGVLFLTPPPEPVAPSRRSNHPILSFDRSSEIPAEWLQIQDPGLFARADGHGFSGAAWMVKAPWTAPDQRSLSPPTFLAWNQAPRERTHTHTTALPPLKHTPPAAQPAFVAIASTPNSPGSRLSVEGLGGRQLISPANLPTQYVTDAIRSTITEVLVDADGIVLSGRLVQSSGSRKADADALEFARKARFGPDESGEPDVLGSGQLIFHWHSLDPSQTNAVKR